MECPSCSHKLTRLTAGDIELDICKGGCGGVWFDRNELLKFDEQHEFDVTRVLGIERDPNAQVTFDERKLCPCCSNEPLVRQYLDHKNKIEMDQCWNCAGIWLDVGELDTLRSQYSTFEERSKAANLMIDDVMKQHQEAMNQRTKEEIDRYNEETSTRFRASLYAIKKLFGA